MHKRRTLIHVWVVIGLSLLACTSVSSLLSPTPTKDHLGAILTVVEANKTSEPAVTPTTKPTSTTSATHTPLPALGFEYGDENLKASDTGKFVRAAGKPQVIELFAFW